MWPRFYSFGRLAVCTVLALACAGTAARSPRYPDALWAVDDLLAADRRFGDAAARDDAVSAISAMLADDAMMPASRGDFARGPAEAASALRDALGAGRVKGEWSPIRGGISADGQHGFTFGYMTVHKPDGASTPHKYLSYWVRRAGAWRVVAYRVGARPPGEVSLAMIPPALPDRLVRPVTDPSVVAAHVSSLVAAERAFSDRAQAIGLGPAFAENGSSDAMNMGGRDSPSFVVGNEAIGRLIGSRAPQATSPVSWNADRALVASSGDLGVTFGFIRPNGLAAEGARGRGVPFFTVWRRAGPWDRWRYVAE